MDFRYITVVIDKFTRNIKDMDQQTDIVTPRSIRDYID